MGLFYNSERDIKRLREDLHAFIKTTNQTLQLLVMNTAEATTALKAARAEITSLSDKLTKIQTEQTTRFDAQKTLTESLEQRVKDLQAIIDAGNAGDVGEDLAGVVDGITADLAAFRAKEQTFDDQVADAPAAGEGGAPEGGAPAV